MSLNLGYRRRVGKAVSAVESAARDLGLLAGVLARLEAEQFAAPKLVELRAALQSQGWPPSRWISATEPADGVSGFQAEHDCQIDRPLCALDVAVRLRG